MHILGALFLLFFVVVLIGVALVSRVVQLIFGLGRKMTGEQTSYNRQAQRDDERAETGQGHKTQKKKVFDDDEGEYIEFEEIKE